MSPKFLAYDLCSFSDISTLIANHKMFYGIMIGDRTGY